MILVLYKTEKALSTIFLDCRIREIVRVEVCVVGRIRNMKKNEKVHLLYQPEDQGI